LTSEIIADQKGSFVKNELTMFVFSLRKRNNFGGVDEIAQGRINLCGAIRIESTRMEKI
jgi:hypothetical protein